LYFKSIRMLPRTLINIFLIKQIFHLKLFSWKISHPHTLTHARTHNLLSITFVALQEMLRTTFNPTIILRSNPVARVNVPYTQAFINDIYNVETSLSAKLPVQKAQIILNQMTNSIELLQYVAGMLCTSLYYTDRHCCALYDISYMIHIT